MLSQEQEFIKQKRIRFIVELFLDKRVYCISDIATMTGYSTSTIQRYLKSSSFIAIDSYLLNVYGKDVNDIITNKLNRAKIIGCQRGGTISTLANQPCRDYDGKFCGNKPVRIGGKYSLKVFRRAIKEYKLMNLTSCTQRTLSTYVNISRGTIQRDISILHKMGYTKSLESKEKKYALHS